MKPLQRFVKIKKETVCIKYSYCIYFFVKNLYYKHVINLHLFFITFFFRTWKSYSHLKNNGFFSSWCVCLCLLAVVTLSSAQTLQRETCDARRSEVDVNVPSADALIGGIFMIREPLMGGYTCGGPHRGMKSINIEKKIFHFFFYEQYNTTSKRLN